VDARAAFLTWAETSAPNAREIPISAAHCAARPSWPVLLMHELAGLSRDEIAARLELRRF
jgi:hypothetical protein